MTNNEAIGILAIVVETAKGRCFVTDEAISDAYAMTISALQAQEAKAQLSAEGTTSDLISRQAAIALANSLKDDLPDDERMVDAVMAHNEGIMEYQTKLSLLPSAQPEQRWIPVSERLPKVAHSVLFSRRSMDTSEGCLQADGKWWQYRWNEILNADQVIAWMPLPEPYRVERRTDEGD